MHKQEFVPENETHKIIWDFEIRTDHQILARRPDLEVIKKKKNSSSCKFCRFCVPQKENERKRKDIQMLWPYQETKKRL